MNLTYQIVLVQEDDKWWAYIPELPGVVGLGNSEEEAKEDITKALELYLKDVREEGKPLPLPNVRRLETSQIDVAVSS
jgi:predicted RNase H-like HicB family nuclease